jgi:hypothetical protein
VYLCDRPQPAEGESSSLLEKDSLVVGNTVEITIDAEAILEES